MSVISPQLRPSNPAEVSLDLRACISHPPEQTRGEIHHLPLQPLPQENELYREVLGLRVGYRGGDLSLQSSSGAESWVGRSPCTFCWCMYGLVPSSGSCTVWERVEMCL